VCGGLVTTESADNLSPDLRDALADHWQVADALDPIAAYQPPPLEVLRTWVQWTVVLPRAIDGAEYDSIKQVGPAALRALGLQIALTHMEWFARPDGSVAVSELGARPPGAQLTSMIGFSHDIDFYSMWAELVLLGTFNPPDRGTAYLRGQGRGRVRTVHGVDEMQSELGHLVVDARLPRPWQPASTSYEGEGFVTVRHENHRRSAGSPRPDHQRAARRARRG
jgi:hypothetical protein